MANRNYIILEDKDGKEVLPVTDGNGVFVEGGTKKLESKLTEIDSKTTELSEQFESINTKLDEHIDNCNAVNPNFTIGTVTTLPSGSDATVTLTGTYPNLVLNFGIPRGADGSGGGTEEPVDTTPYMYYGRLSFQDVGGTNSVIPYSQITEAMINKGVTDGKLTKEAPKTMGRTSMGEAKDTAELDYIIVAVPASKNYTVTKDNGIGGKMAFDEDTAGANGVDITINNVACKLYGEMLLSQGQYFIYVD